MAAQEPGGPSDSFEFREQMQALVRANVNLLNRLDGVERRLAALEGRPVPEPRPVPPPVASTVPKPSPPPPPPAEPETHEAEAPLAHPARVPAEQSVETAVGLNWLNRIGAFTLILGVAFFFKYAVDNNWIGPAGRVMLGILAGASLLGGGEILRRKGHAVYAQGLGAAGVSVLYLSFWAAGSLYKLIPVGLAFVALVADTALAGALAVRQKAVALAVLGLLGGYLTPIALSTGEYHPWIFYSFNFLLNAAWLTVARSQGWRVLDLIALPITLVLCGGMGVSLHTVDQGPAGTFAALSQYAVFILSPIPFFPAIAQLVAGIAAGLSWAGEPEGFAAPALTLAAVGLCFAHIRRIAALPLVALAGFAAGYVLTQDGAGAGHTGLLLVTAVGGFLILHIWLPLRLVRGLSITRSDLALQPANAVFLFAAGMDLLDGRYRDWSGLFAAAMGALYLGTGLLVWPKLREQAQDRKPVVLLAGVAIALFTAAVPVQFESIRITILWAVEAVALAWIARRFEGWQGRAACLFVSALALVRLLAFDLFGLMGPAAGETLLLNSRFATVLAVALSLGAAAWILKPEKWALPPYLGAHLAMLTGLGVEIARHAARVATADEHSYAMVGISLMMAAYGLALVAVGVAGRTRLNRMLGLGLLAVVVAKLYLVDVWTMRRIYRIVAFAGLGGLLLATSFLYSRFRAKIEALLADETH